MHGYDPQLKDIKPSSEKVSRNMHFYGGIISHVTNLTRPDFPEYTLEKMMADNGDEGKSISYLKMDIEHNERTVLPQIFNSTILHKVSIDLSLHIGQYFKREKIINRRVLLIFEKFSILLLDIISFELVNIFGRVCSTVSTVMIRVNFRPFKCIFDIE